MMILARQPQSWKEMQERGRLMAARSLQTDPVKREDMEQRWGVDYMQSIYPEAYSGPTVVGFRGALAAGWSRLLGGVRG